jgi:hypothetical protein
MKSIIESLPEMVEEEKCEEDEVRIIDKVYHGFRLNTSDRLGFQ